MNVIYGTNATISFKNSAGEWVELGSGLPFAFEVDEEVITDDTSWVDLVPQSFTFELTCTWQTADPWAFALPPAGMMPMYN